MEHNEPIAKGDVIGRRIRFVLHRDLPCSNDFQERQVILELESGLRFALEQDYEIIDVRTGIGTIYPYPGADDLYVQVDVRKQTNLASPIQSTVCPFGYKYSCGVILENEFIVYDGIGRTENGVLFYACDADLRPKMKFFELPTK